MNLHTGVLYFMLVVTSPEQTSPVYALLLHFFHSPHLLRFSIYFSWLFESAISSLQIMTLFISLHMDISLFDFLVVVQVFVYSGISLSLSLSLAHCNCSQFNFLALCCFWWISLLCRERRTIHAYVTFNRLVSFYLFVGILIYCGMRMLWQITSFCSLILLQH